MSNRKVGGEADETPSGTGTSGESDPFADPKGTENEVMEDNVEGPPAEVDMNSAGREETETNPGESPGGGEERGENEERATGMAHTAAAEAA